MIQAFRGQRHNNPLCTCLSQTVTIVALAVYSDEEYVILVSGYINTKVILHYNKTFIDQFTKQLKLQKRYKTACLSAWSTVSIFNAVHKAHFHFVNT